MIQADNRHILEVLKGTVEQIDLGCSVCIRDFADCANTALLAAGYKYGYKMVDGSKVTVEVVKLDQADDADGR